MRTFLIILLIALIVCSFFGIRIYNDKLPDALITIIATFWGFFLSQAGLIIYEHSKEKEDYMSMLIAVCNEIYMNKATISWINYLLKNRLTEKEIHGFGFSSVDQVSTTATENLVHSPLLFKFSSRHFSSKYILSIYQTLLQFRREIPTENVDGRNPSAYIGINFERIIPSFTQLSDWIDSEGIRLVGRRKWRKLIQATILRDQLIS